MIKTQIKSIQCYYTVLHPDRQKINMQPGLRSEKENPSRMLIFGCSGLTIVNNFRYLSDVWGQQVRRVLEPGDGAVTKASGHCH